MSKRTLLLADDSVTIQKVVNLTFADEGIEVVTVGDGDSAMEKISQLSPDVVLADVHMPGLSGYQICEIVRQNPVTKDMPVVLLVGSFEPFDESEATRVGANAYLTKPFQSIRQLVTQVTDLMDASARHAEPEAEAEAAAERAGQDTGRAGEGEKVRDTNDIDSLIQQSFSEPGAVEAEAPSAAPRYVDAGMDDEMIETSFADSEQPEAERPAEVESEPEAAPVAEVEPVTEDTVETEWSTSRDASFPSEVSHTAASAAFATESHSAPDPSNDYRYDAATAAVTEEPTAEFNEFSRTEQIPAFDNPATSAGAYADDMELLELPPIESRKTLEFTTTQRSMAEAGSRQVVSISPELMDLIVQKVVEKLSEKY